MSQIDTQTTPLPEIQEIAIDPLVSRVSGRSSRLSLAEQAYIRGLSALLKRDFLEAHRQLSGYLKLVGSTEPTESKDSELEILVETLRLFLAIRRESAILDPTMR